MKKRLCVLWALVLSLLLAACTVAAVPEAEPDADAVPEQQTETVPEADAETVPETPEQESGTVPEDMEAVPDEDGFYTARDDVAAYLYAYGHLPGNFLTKSEARKLGWEGGSLEPYAPGMSIGGDRFGNYEGLLPDGHSYHECDLNTMGAKSRGAERLVYSDDGLIYYTGDHYASFELLYGETLP